MTTRHSSLQPAALIDQDGNTIHLGELVGKGGEGSVYQIQGKSDSVAKIYHQKSLDSNTVAKLEAMLALKSPELSTIAAWPEAIIYNQASKKPCGLVMPWVKNARQLHELYGSASRRLHFPEVRWHHLLLAARNLAAAFDTMHSAGIIVGDVNQGNLLVDSQMRVRFIDCDSFQINHNGQTFHCPVGTPHFTPSELQSLTLRDVSRTKNHDGFGLAVLIFHLIFVGRHPYAGRFRGQGDLPIEKAISERRFAFARDRNATLVDPPPACLSLDDLPQVMGDLFERAFRLDAPPEHGGEGKPRPAPSEWAKALEVLMRQRKICGFDELHIHYDQLNACPWCRIEDEGGPSFFVPDGGVSVVSQDRLYELDRRIATLQVKAFPELGVKRLNPPSRLVIKELQNRPKISRLDFAALGMALGILAGVAGIFYLPAVGISALLCLGFGIYLLVSAKGKERRNLEANLENRLEAYRQNLFKIGGVIRKNYLKARKNYDDLVAELRKAIGWYKAEGDKLQEVLKEHRSTHLTEFLRQHLIRDNVSEIPGMTTSIVAMLESYNVETALNVDQLILSGIPNISSVVTMEMMQWRANLERNFKFKPDHGVTQDQLKYAEEAATQKFKIAQARKVLMGSKQLDALAHGGKAELMHALGQFDKVADQATSVAKELRDFESGRRKLERNLNGNQFVLLGLTFGVPVVSYVLHSFLS